MKRGTRITMTIALSLILGWSTVWAQEQDDFLQRYELALENLAASVQSLPEAGSVAREELDRAVNALRTLARTTDRTTLVNAMERIFERAREAIENQSPVDLAVQVEVLRGGFQRLVYDAALQSAIEGDLESARLRLLEIAADVGVPDDTIAALADTQRSIAELRYAFEAGVAATVQERLQTVREQAATNLDDAYRTLADAYSDYLLVQDSPRVPNDVNSAFVSAANALVNTQVDPLLAELETLIQRFAALQEAAANALEDEPIPAEPSEPSEPTELPNTLLPNAAAQNTEVQNTEAAEPGDGTPAPPASAVESPDAAAPAGEPAVGADGEALTDDVLAADDALVAEIAARLVAEERQQQIAVIAVELATAGVAEIRRGDLAAQILDGGYRSLENVVRDLYADASEAAAAVERGQPEAARGFVSVFSERYRQFLAPIMATVAPETDLRTVALTSQLATTDGMRLQDVAVLSSHAGALREVLAGGEPSATHSAAVDTVRFWAGLVRLVTVIVFGLLAVIPLYLLNLAFGGGNRNWQLVGVALLLLFVPIIYEAIALIADLVAVQTGIDALYAVSRYSMFNNAISQVAWAGVTAVAIMFAIGGLYGICRQFGLLGRRSPATTTHTEVRDTVEWDEEF